MREPFEHVRLRSLVGWIVSTVVVLILVSLLLRELIGNRAPYIDAALTGLLFYASLAFWARSELRIARVPLRVLLQGKWGKVTPGEAAVLAPALLLFALAADWLSELGLETLGLHRAVQTSLSHPHADGPWLLPMTLAVAITSVVVAPIVEELVFRGLLLRSWAYHRSLNGAIWVPALLSATLAPTHFPALLVTGLLCGVLYLRSKSLALPIAAHALFNATPLLLGEQWRSALPTWGTHYVVAGQLLAALVALAWYMGSRWPKPVRPPAQPAAESQAIKPS